MGESKYTKEALDEIRHHNAIKEITKAMYLDRVYLNNQTGNYFICTDLITELYDSNGNLLELKRSDFPIDDYEVRFKLGLSRVDSNTGRFLTSKTSHYYDEKELKASYTKIGDTLTLERMRDIKLKTLNTVKWIGIATILLSLTMFVMAAFVNYKFTVASVVVSALGFVYLTFLPTILPKMMANKTRKAYFKRNINIIKQHKLKSNSLPESTHN